MGNVLPRCVWVCVWVAMASGSCAWLASEPGGLSLGATLKAEPSDKDVKCVCVCVCVSVRVCVCVGMDPSSDEIVDTCLGDLYSVSWMEDSECEDPTEETLKVTNTPDTVLLLATGFVVASRVRD